MEHLANLAPEDAFRLAISRSRHAPSVLAKHLGVSESFLRRVTSAEKYFPSYDRYPGLLRCRGQYPGDRVATCPGVMHLPPLSVRYPRVSPHSGTEPVQRAWPCI